MDKKAELVVDKPYIYVAELKAVRADMFSWSGENDSRLSLETDRSGKRRRAVIKTYIFNCLTCLSN